MSVGFISKGGNVHSNVSNGEWYALTKMGECFGIEGSWNGRHDSGQKWSPEQLRQLADRAEQIGRAAEYLRDLADDGGIEEIY